MKVNLGVVMDPLDDLQVQKDSTLAMLLEAQRRKWPVWVMTQKDLAIEDGNPVATMGLVHFDLEKSPWYAVVETKRQPLTACDIILMRKDPPFDMEYIYTTHVLDLAEKQGVLVVNKAQSLRDANEKLFTLSFPQCCPPSYVGRRIEDLKKFLRDHEKVVFKPLEGMGGQSIFLVTKNDPNITVILETLTHYETRFIMAQQFIPEVCEGDKRILLIDGEPIDYGLTRIPKEGDIRGNLAVGAKGVGVEIDDRDRWICQQLKPTLCAMGLMFVGIDVIGGYLTEINVTSPTCIREIDSAFSLNISAQLLDVLRTKISSS